MEFYLVIMHLSLKNKMSFISFVCSDDWSSVQFQLVSLHCTASWKVTNLIFTSLCRLRRRNPFTLLWLRDSRKHIISLMLWKVLKHCKSSCCLIHNFKIFLQLSWLNWFTHFLNRWCVWSYDEGKRWILPSIDMLYLVHYD